MKAKYRARIARLVAVMLAITVIAGAAPAMASVMSAGGSWRSSFTPTLAMKQAWAEKRVGPATETADDLAEAAYRKDAPVPRPEPVPVSSTPGVAPTGGGTSGSATPSSATRASASSKRSSGSELAQAQAILSGLIAQHPILAGTTVTFGDARGYQAICYYKSGRIVISPSHTRSLSTILNHEVWHVIDWRDNGQIDWGENVPPQ